MGIISIPLPTCISPPQHASIDEVKQWIKSIDTNHDGKISKQELQAALAHLGKWYTDFKGRYALWKTDLNDNGYIDTPAEFKELEVYAQKHWGHRIAFPA